MTIRDLFNWIIDIKLWDLFVVIFLIIFCLTILISILRYYSVRDFKKRQHLKDMEDENYRKKYISEKRGIIIMFTIIILIFGLPLIAMIIFS